MAKPSAWAIVPNLLRSLFRTDVPLRSKFLLVAGIVYLLSPIDLLPDIVAGIGWIDDLIIVPLLGWLSYRSLPPSVKADVAQGDCGPPAKSRIWLYLVILIAVLLGMVILTGPDDAFLKSPLGSYATFAL